MIIRRVLYAQDRGTGISGKGIESERASESGKALEWKVGWHTGMARVGEVQPGPVPAKPVPIRVWVQTCTASPTGFCKHCGYL